MATTGMQTGEKGASRPRTGGGQAKKHAVGMSVRREGSLRAERGFMNAVNREYQESSPYPRRRRRGKLDGTGRIRGFWGVDPGDF